jgi:hypothetical protein
MREMAKLNVPERELLESRTGLKIGTPGREYTRMRGQEHVMLLADL